ncbi:MAG: tetratricopeptide repeat protein, partial [Sulfurimicrobium sp.]
MKKLLVILVVLWSVVRPVLADEMSPETKRAQIHTELGAGYFSMGKLGIALEELNTAIKVDSNYAPAYNMLGLLYMELREYDKAGDYFKRS